MYLWKLLIVKLDIFSLIKSGSLNCRKTRDITDKNNKKCQFWRPWKTSSQISYWPCWDSSDNVCLHLQNLRYLLFCMSRQFCSWYTMLSWYWWMNFECCFLVVLDFSLFKCLILNTCILKVWAKIPVFTMYSWLFKIIIPKNISYSSI